MYKLFLFSLMTIFCLNGYAQKNAVLIEAEKLLVGGEKLERTSGLNPDCNWEYARLTRRRTASNTPFMHK